MLSPGRAWCAFPRWLTGRLDVGCLRRSSPPRRTGIRRLYPQSRPSGGKVGGPLGAGSARAYSPGGSPPTLTWRLSADTHMAALRRLQPPPGLAEAVAHRADRLDERGVLL